MSEQFLTKVHNSIQFLKYVHQTASNEVQVQFDQQRHVQQRARKYFSRISEKYLGSNQIYCTPRFPNPKFKYETGQTYIYDYESETATSVVGVSDDETKTKLSCRVSIEVLSDCNFKLKVRNVKVEIPGMESRKITEYQSTLSSYGLTFSFNDGSIEHICPSSEDPVWSVNIKRGILSAMQNNMRNLKTDDSLREIDISGNCITDYKPVSSFWGGSEIVKTKRIDSCTNRNGNRSVIQSDHYFVPYAGIQSVPVMKSSSVCKQNIHKSSIIDTVKCEETHLFRPFTNKENGATTKVTSKLTYGTKKKSTSRLGKISSRKSLLFEHTDEENEKSSMRELEKVAYEICSSTKTEVESNLPELFNQLVAAMQTLSEKDITEVHDKIMSDNACKSSMAMSVFMDAIPVAGNAGALSVFVKMSSSSHLSSFKLKSMLTSLAFHPRPSEESIKALLPLIDTTASDVKVDALLSISSMIHTYCRQNTDCQSSKVLDDVFNSLNKLLGYKCRTQKPEEIRAVIIALKSLGNIGRHGKLASTIQECYDHPTVSHKVRLAAIESYRRVPCSKDEAENKLNLLKKTHEDVELRIAAYLSTMQCVSELRSYKLLNEVLTLLKSEEVNQVGSFIWSHLTNLQETTSPVKQQLKSMLLRYSVKERTPNDIRQFSRNFDWSVMNEKYNVGGNLESNVIFTPKSYLPRSVMANVSANLFGYSVNMLEVGGRMEGLEHHVEKHFAAHKVGSALKSLSEKLPSGIYEKIKEIENRVNRQKRATYSEDHMQDIDRQVNEIQDASPDGSFYVKIFGNEIQFITFDDFKNWNTASIPNFSQMLMKMAEGHDVNIAKSMVVANNRFSVPTIAGFPVRIAVNGTSTLGAKIKGKFDIRNAILNPRTLNIDGSIEPSGAVLISSAMYVDTGISRHGLKMKMNYHSSSVVSCKVYYNNGEFELKLDAPRKNIDLLTMKSEMLMINPGSETPLKMNNVEQYTIDTCYDGFNNTLGFEICVDMKTPKPFYSPTLPYGLNGQSSFKLSLKKVDETMSGYKFSGKYQAPKQLLDDMLLKLEFDTPGSKINRHFLFDVSMKNADKRLSVMMKSPIMSLDVIGSLMFKEYLEKAELDITYIGSKRYLINAEMNIQKTTSDSYEYHPNIRLELADMTPITLNGKFGVYYKDQSFNILEVDLKSSQYNTEPSHVKATHFQASFNLSVEFPSYKLHYEEFFSKNPNIISSDVVLWYEPEGQERNTITVNTKLKDLSTESLRKYNTILGMTNALNPDYNWQTVWDLQMAKGYLENGVTIGYGKNVNWDKHKIKYLEIIQYKLNDENELTHLDVLTNIKQATREMDYGLHTIMNLEKTDSQSHLTLNSTVKYSKNKEITSSMDVNVMSFAPFKMSAEVLVDTPEKSFIYREVTTQKPGKTGFKGNVFVQWDSEKSIQHVYHLNIPGGDYPPKQVELTGTISGKGCDSYPITYEFKRNTASPLAHYSALINVKNTPEYNLSIEHDKDMKMMNSKWDFPISSGSIKLEEGPKFNFDLLVKKPKISVNTNFLKKENEFDGKVSWDVEDDREKQFAVEVNWKKSPHPKTGTNRHNVNGKVMSQNVKLFSIKAEGNEAILSGPHSIDTEVNVPENTPVRVFSKYELTASKFITVFDYYHEKQRKVHSQLHSNFEIAPNGMLSADVKFIIKSAYEAVRDFELYHEFSNKMGSNDKEIDHSRKNGKKTITFNGNSVLTSSFEGFEKSTTDFSGEITEDWEFILNSKGKDFEGKVLDQSVVISILKNKVDVAYALKSSKDYSLDFGVLASKGSDYKSWKYDAYFIRNDKEYKLNVSKTSSSRIETTNVILKTPYDSLKDLRVVNNNNQYDPFGVDLSAEWNSDQKAAIFMKTTQNADTIRIDGELSAPWFAKITMDTQIGNNQGGKQYQLSVMRKNKQLFYFKATQSLSDDRQKVQAVSTLLFKLNQQKLLDLNVDRSWDEKHMKIIVTVSGAFDEISTTIESTSLGNGLEPKLKICLPSAGKCIEMNMKFSAMKNSSAIASKFLVTFEQKSGKHFGYDFSYQANNMKLDLITPGRKAQLVYDSSNSNRGDTYKIALSGNAKDHALQIELFVDANKNSFRLDVTHPTLKKPIVVKFQNRRLDKSFTTQTDIEYSSDKSKNLKIETSIGSFNENNNTASLRIYTPHSKRIDVTMKSHVGFARNELSMGASATWQSRELDTKPKEIYIYYITKMPSNTFNFYYRHPGRVIDVTGNYQEKQVENYRGLSMTAVAINNGVRKNIDAEFSFKKLWLNFLVTESANPSERYHVNVASLDDDKTVQIIAERSTNGQNIREVTIQLHVNSSHIVHTSVQWNPVIIKKIIADAKEDFKLMWQNLNTTRDVLSEIGLEIEDKISIISDAISKEMVEPMVVHVKGHYEETGKELGGELLLIENMLNNYLDELKKFVEKEYELVKAKMEKALEPLKTDFEAWKVKVEAKLEEYRKYCEENYPKTYQKLKDIISSLTNAVEEEYVRLTKIYEDQGFEGIVSDYRDQWSYNVTFTNDLFESYNATASVYDWISRASDELENIKNSTAESYEKFVAKISDSKWVQAMLKYKNYLSDKYGEYRYRWNQYVEKLQERLDEYPELKKIYTNSQRFYLTVINIKDGVVSWDVALPYTPAAMKEWTTSQSTYQSMEEPGYSYWDTYYQMKPHTNPRKWIPPFDSTATLIGSQHYLTFDKKHYDFVGTCSYILAKDFKDENLTVIAHYGKDRRISLTVIVGKNQIDISNDFKVHVNKKESDLPISMPQVTVSRKSNTVTVSSHRNKIECDWAHDVCTVYLNGWYFGKTAGMFGRYDNEPSSDMKKPNGEPVKEIYELADSWSVSSKCSTIRNLAQTTTVAENSNAHKRCVAHFKSVNSPLRPCFTLVKPEEYLNMCLTSAPKDVFCNVASAYVSSCRNKEAYINMPNECDNSDVDYEPVESDNETIDSYESNDVDLSEHEDDGVMLSDSWKRIADIFSDCRPNSLPELVLNFSGVNPALNCNANNSVLDCFKKFITNVKTFLNDSKKNRIARSAGATPLVRKGLKVILLSIKFSHFQPNSFTCDIRPQQAKILQHGESVKIKTDMRRKSTDVVYIIENKDCNNDMIKKLLKQPPMILSRELRTQRIYSRVSVVSYGGKNQPEVHTAKGKSFYSFRDMVLAMRTLYKMPRDSSDEPSDAFEAIRFASAMSFQPAAAKIFILVKCSACKDGSTISYSDTQNLLLQQGITLHVMTPDPIVVKSGNIGKSKRMFGISARSVYSQKDVSQKKLVGTPALRNIVAVPKDLCIALAQEVGGTFFTEMPLMKYSSLEKNFNLVMSRQITSTAVPQECQNCVCSSTFDGVGKTICVPCEIPSPLQPSNIYQTEDDLNMIYKRIKSKKWSKKQN
ncbi:Apolipophorin [Nymphon striatum]|nr:Apolipophorin [Nymphon striatum]